MLCNVFGIYHNFITRSHCFNNWSLSTRGMILVVSNVFYSSQYMGWKRGVDNATLFTCLLPGSVPAPVARVLSMDNAHNCRVEITVISEMAIFRSLNIIPLRKSHTAICDSSILQCQQRLFCSYSYTQGLRFLVTAQARYIRLVKPSSNLSHHHWAAVQSKDNVMH